MADIAMTGEAGANRTFRSIFGDQEKQHDEGIKLQQDQSGSSKSVAAASGAGVAMDDDDEAMWGDEPPLDHAMAQGNNDLPGLQFAQRKSMEEWAEDDDEEENWKEALQDRVNQLELAFEHNNDATAAESRRRFEQLRGQQFSAQHIDFGQSLPASTRLTATSSGSERLRPATRHKMQRTSSSHACITGETADHAASGRPNHLWNFQRKAAGGTTPTPIAQDARTRSTFIDFVARNIQTVEHHRKRSGSLSGASSRTDSPRHSLSRKNSLDSNHSSLGRSNSSCLRGNKAAAPADTTPPGAAVFNLSDTEAIRRFVLDDVKTMSMERLVGDAQRLHFLEDFYQNHHALGPGPSIMTSTTAAPLSPASSSAMSTS